jgi:glycosyltransferase involved in cell wall biosynthesis
MTLGIGVITYKRTPALHRTVARVLEHTKSPYYLVVADDGSHSSTYVNLLDMGIPVITGANRGVCWNKNRALYALLEHSDADPILILEDDCYPTQDGWEEAWVRAALKFRHVNYTHTAWPVNWCKGGYGTADDPWLTWELTGQATITTRDALKTVGYLNPHFKGYGHGHIEWSERFCKAGLLNREFMPCIRCGLVMEDDATFRNKSEVTRNWHIAQELRRHVFAYCPPWHTEIQKQALENEVKEALEKTPLVVRDCRVLWRNSDGKSVQVNWDNNQQVDAGGSMTS